MIIISRKARKLLKSLLDIRNSQESPRIKPEQYKKLIDEQGEPLGELIYHKLVIQDIAHDIAVTDEGIYFYQAYKEHNRNLWFVLVSTSRCFRDNCYHTSCQFFIF